MSKAHESKHISRRSLGRAALIAPSALLAAACGTDGTTDEIIRVAELDELDDGTPIAFSLGHGPLCFAVKLRGPAQHGVGPDQNIVAYSTLCPHMGCPIDPSAADPETGHFGPCSCHQSLFSLRNDGRLVHGRACSNLARIELEVRGNTVVALGKTRPAFGDPLSEADALATVDAAAQVEEAGS
ncbi:MAG: Rieske 2Fe-2S domain-containing protein [Nannocystales bacterium]